MIIGGFFVNHRDNNSVSTVIPTRTIIDDSGSYIDMPDINKCDSNSPEYISAVLKTNCSLSFHKISFYDLFNILEKNYKINIIVLSKEEGIEKMLSEKVLSLNWINTSFESWFSWCLESWGFSFAVKDNNIYVFTELDENTIQLYKEYIVRRNDNTDIQLSNTE